jgi:hypothetical protein
MLVAVVAAKLPMAQVRPLVVLAAVAQEAITAPEVTARLIQVAGAAVAVSVLRHTTLVALVAPVRLLFV